MGDFKKGIAITLLSALFSLGGGYLIWGVERSAKSKDKLIERVEAVEREKASKLELSTVRIECVAYTDKQITDVKTETKTAIEAIHKNLDLIVKSINDESLHRKETNDLLKELIRSKN